MWLYSGIIQMCIIIYCRAREDELDYLERALSNVIRNITEINQDLLHYIRNAQKSIGDMKTVEIISPNDRNEIKSGPQIQDKNLRFANDLSEDDSGGSIEIFSFDPRTRLNILEVLRNILKLYKRAIPEIQFKSDTTTKQKIEFDGETKKDQLKDIWETLPLKLKSLLQNEDNLSFKSSKEDKKPMIIVLANVDKIGINEDDRSATKGSESREERIKENLRDGCVNCVKAQVKKCYKALKDSTKRTCLTYNCKSSFKKTFKTNSKKGCAAEFSNEDNHNGREKRNNTANLYVNYPDRSPRHTRTRVDLDFECEDDKDNLHPRSLDQLIKPITPASPGYKTMNILRDKYEKACNKAIAKKCNKVCIDVITLTCSEHNCMKKQIKSLKKDCKKSCATVFGVSKSKDDSSDSSDEEDEEDESESD